MRLAVLVLAAIVLSGCDEPFEKKGQVNECQMDAERVYPERPEGDDAIFLSRMSFIVTCMRARHYDIDFTRPHCDGKTPPAPQIRPECYFYDWAGKPDAENSN